MKARTVGLDTLTHHQRQFPQARERGDRAMAVIGHPQELSTLLTVLFQRGQRFLMRRFQARGSSSHHLSPVGLLCLLLLSGYTPCQVFFAIQRKKKVLQASERKEEERSQWREHTQELDASKFVF